MSMDEKLRLLRLAENNPDWQNARLAAILALNTTMRGCEIKQLRWRDINLMGRTLTICKSKTLAGERVIPLNATAFSAVLELRERAKRIGASEPQHFVFQCLPTTHTCVLKQRGPRWMHSRSRLTVNRAVTTQRTTQTDNYRQPHLWNYLKRMVGPNGLEPSTSSVSRKRSNQTELRA